MNIYQNVPEQFHKRYLETLTQLADEETQSDFAGRKHEKRGKKSNWTRVGYAGAAAAAVFVATLTLCAANPTLAANLPVVGNIFNAMQNRFGFGHIPEEGTVILIPQGTDSETDFDADSEIGSGSNVSNKTDSIITSPYQATDNGITLSVEEYYASNQAIFLGIRLVTDEPLPDDLTDQMIFLSTEHYSFREDDPHEGGWNYIFERIDESTFLGILRIDYDQIGKDMRKYTEAVLRAEANGAELPVLSAETEKEYVEYYDIPDEFKMDIDFTSLWVYHISGKAGLSRQSLKGSWHIADIPIRQSTEGTQIIAVNDVNEEGFGLDHVKLSPVELTIYPVEPADHLTFAVVLDKTGQILRFGGDNCYQLAVQGHDISEITVYVCDYDEYMDEIKGYTLSDDTAALKEILEEKCLYHKSIITDVSKTTD